ncbi:MAG TPA: MFS transporter [Burkholderiales bacterium]|nr:MFS transporter [Burkholderiales bacterium]
MNGPEPRPRRSEWHGAALGVLATVFACNLLGRGSGETYTVFLKPLEREFGWSRSQLTGVYSLYLLVGGFLAPFVGTLFDRVGPRAVYATGLAAIAAAFLLGSVLTNLLEYYLYAGAMIGVGVALVGMVPASGLLMRWYQTRLSAAIGLAFAAAGLGTLLFVPVTQVLISHLDWRTTYRVLGFALLAFVPLMLFGLPWHMFAAGHPEYRRRIRDRPHGEGWTLAAALRTPTYWGLCAMFFFTSVGMFSVMPQAVVYLIDAGFAPVAAASAYGVIGMLSVATLAGIGFVAARFGYRRTVTASFVGSGLGMTAMLTLSFYPVAWLLVVYVVVFGACQGARGPIISAICTTKFAGPRVATIYGTMYAMNSIGAAIGSATGGLLHDMTDGYVAVFAFALTALACAATPMWVVRELREFR